MRYNKNGSGAVADNKFTRKDVMARCVPMSLLQSVLGGKWKFLILWYIAVSGVQRFGSLLRTLDGITQSTLTKQLRELEDDGFIHREVYREVPPKVEYTLTERGRRFVPVLVQMVRWSQANLCDPGYVSPYTDEQIDALVSEAAKEAAHGEAAACMK